MARGWPQTAPAKIDRYIDPGKEKACRLMFPVKIVATNPQFRREPTKDKLSHSKLQHGRDICPDIS
jgi:hypothetical protein